jgi:hypothetical protein
LPTTLCWNARGYTRREGCPDVWFISHIHSSSGNVRNLSKVKMAPHLISQNQTPPTGKRPWKNILAYTCRSRKTDCRPYPRSFKQKCEYAKTTYIAGMWKDSLLEDILWYRPWNFLRKGDLRPERISPSWSWASVRGPVTFPRPLPGQGGQLEGVQITEISFGAKGLPHMGEYSEASIKLKAPFTEAVFDSSHSGSDPTMSDLREKQDSSYQSSKNIACGVFADYYFLDAQYENLESQQYAFVFISFIGQGCRGLILRQRSDTEYERIGTCWCYIPSKELNGDASVEERGVRSYLSSLPFREVKII